VAEIINFRVCPISIRVSQHMAQVRQLAHAPIAEALIDMKVQAAEGTTVESLEKALTGREFGYYKRGPVIRGQFGFVINTQDLPPTQQVLSNTAIIGVRMHSADERYVAQFTTQGFTLSRLEPYESWEALVSEATRIWLEYRACVNPTLIHRVATRFINNLRLPLKVGERFERYLIALPNMPGEFPQAVSSFLQRFVIYDEASGATAVLTQALEGFPLEPPVPVILDIDVFRESRFAVEGNAAWDYLSQLRVLKNRFFFGALTEEAMELYL
jgi:uncharacterized protein (TIGR04255 family)